MTEKNRTHRGHSALWVAIMAAFVLTLALPSAAWAGSVAPASGHLQQNWSKSHAATPTPLANCVLPSAATGDDCYNPGTHLTWTLTLDVCTSSNTTCTGSSQSTILLSSVVALLPPGETYIASTETGVTSPSNAAVFTTGSCSSVSAPADCASLSVPTDTYLRWNFSSASLNGHPQAQFTYTANLTAADGAILDDFAIAHYTVSTLAQNPVVSDEVFVATPILSIAKSCPAQVENNSAIQYGITMTNSGHENASGVTASDPAVAGVTFTGASATSPTASFSPTLASWTGTLHANSTVNATFDANINTSATSVTNTVNYTAFPPATVFIEHNSSCTTQVVHPSISVKKTVDPTLVSAVTAHTINVSANVTNTGDDTLFNLTAVDSLAGALTCAATTLAVGASTTCTGSYVIPKGDLAKWSNDTVNVTANDKFNAVVKAHDHASVQILHPGIEVVKKVSPTIVSSLTANTIAITATVTNTGDTTLFNVSVTDSIAGALSCPSSTLAAGASENCTGSYVIVKGTSANWSNDTVNASGNDRLNDVVTANDSASVQIVHPAIEVVKVVNPTLVSDLVNNTISVTATVTNIGTQTLYNVTVVDTLAGTLTCPSTTLAPSASMNCTGSYVIPKGDSAKWSNDTVTATGNDQFHNTVTGNSSASVQIVHPAFTVLKTVNPTSVVNTVNNTINITAKVTNTGDVTLVNLTVVDSIAGALSCPSTTLAVGASMNCTGSYVIPKGTPAGFSNDTVTATGCDGLGNCLQHTSKASVTITAPTPSGGLVTDTMFCPLTNGTFRVIANSGQIKSTNPGQFYYNVFSTSGMAHGATLTVTIPYPFVTSGANPAQVFAHAPPTCPSTPPNTNLNSEFKITPTTFGLGAYSPQNFGSTVTVTFQLTGPSISAGTQLWFAVHLNYGLKGMPVKAIAPGSAGCPTPANTGTCLQLTLSPTVIIGNLQSYTFGNSLSGTNTVYSSNSVNGAMPFAAAPSTPVFGLRTALGLMLGLVGLVVFGRDVRPDPQE
jgi:uncharacterized repeat protein (TIGR01451 family)